MPGCGGCGPETCNGPCSRRASASEDGPRNIGTVNEAIARIIVDNKVIRRTLELVQLGVVRLDDLVDQIHAEKNAGLL